MGSSCRTMSLKMKPSTDALSIEPHVAMPDDTFRAGRREATIRNLLVAGGVLGAVGVIAALGGKAHLHAPDLGLLAVQPITLQIHIAAALTAFLLGCIMLVRPKGDPLHKAIGWTWVIAMLVTALSTFTFPWVLRGHLSVIHLLSGWVAISVPAGIAFVRRGDIKAHRRIMTQNFLFGLIVAGAFTFVPGRLMWKVFFG